MKKYLVLSLFLSLGVFYSNYFIADEQISASEKFIISQAEILEKNQLDQKDLTASLINLEDQTKSDLQDIIKDLQGSDNSSGDELEIDSIDLAESKSEIKEEVLEEEPKDEEVTENQEFTLIKSFPEAGASTLSLVDEIEFQFSHPVSLSEFYQSFSLTESGEEESRFNGEIRYAGDDSKNIILTPVPSLEKSKVYILKLDTSLQDLSHSNFLKEAYISEITVE